VSKGLSKLDVISLYDQKKDLRGMKEDKEWKDSDPIQYPYNNWEVLKRRGM